MKTEKLRTDPQKRLYSLDALRGFDMFWITGGGGLAILLSNMTGAEWLSIQMYHVDWEGFQFMDLVFPLFMFISGVAIPFSVLSKLENSIPKSKLIWKTFRRFVLLVILGLLYNGVFRDGFENARIASVLGQIGTAYFLASIIAIYFQSLRSRIIWLVAILVGIGIIQLLVPVPGIGAGVLTPEGSINGYIDGVLLPGKFYGGTFDPEGILCSISATGITLMGTLAGSILKDSKRGDWQKIGLLSISGVTSILLALALSSFYPIIKSCWTSTFNLLTGGISLLLLALFYLLIDHWGLKKWAFYFRVIGMNSIFIYLFQSIVNVPRVTDSFIGWLEKPMGQFWDLFWNISYLAVIWLLLYYMYKKKIFIRV